MTTYLATEDGGAKEGTCIFCGTVEMMTGEHIFANWTSKAVRPDNHTHAALTYRYKGEIRKETIDLTKFKGDRNIGHANMRLYVLCEECNSGWGSSLQEETSKVLKPVLDGSTWHLSNRERETVAKWLTSLIMVRQYLHPELKAIGEEVCREFFRARVPMTGLSVWVARYGGSNSHECRYRGHVMTTSSSPNPVSPNTCSLACVIGNLIFFVFWSSDADIIRHFSTDDPGPLGILNSIAKQDGRREWIANPENIRDMPAEYEGPANYPLHDMLAELGMTQVWPTFEKYSEASLKTLTRQDFIQLNDLTTYTVTTMDDSLENAREAAHAAADPDELT